MPATRRSLHAAGDRGGVLGQAAGRLGRSAGRRSCATSPVSSSSRNRQVRSRLHGVASASRSTRSTTVSTCSTGRRASARWSCRSRTSATGRARKGGARMAERTLLRNAQVLTCSGDPAERPVDGDVLIEGNRIAAVSAGRLADRRGVGTRRRRAAARRCSPGSATRTPTSAGRSTSCSTSGGGGRAARRRTRSTSPRWCARSSRAATRSSSAPACSSRGDDVLAKDAIDRGLIPGPRIVPSGDDDHRAGRARRRRRHDGGRGRRPASCARSSPGSATPACAR